jgi:uncharacterized membrane protein (UPF0182 family)
VSKSRRVRFIVLVVVGVVLFLAPLLASYYVDWLWFGEVGLRVVFWQSLGSKLVVGACFGAVLFALLYGNIEAALRLVPRYRALEMIGIVDGARKKRVAVLRRIGIGLSVAISLLVALATSTSWLTFLAAHHGVPFGVEDPIFHRDIGFYVFQLPAWEYVQAFLFSSLIASTIVAVVVHVLLGAVVVDRERPSVRVQNSALSHVCLLLAAIFVVTGLGHVMKAWRLLFSSNGVVFGAGYTDLHARMPAIHALMIVAFVAAIALALNVRWQRRLLPIWAIGGWTVAYGVLLGIFPAAMQSLVVNPNQGEKEATYIGYNIQATRAAYALDRISSANLSLKGDLNRTTLEKNDTTLRNIRLWDPDTLLNSYRQLQELRPYYSFTDVDVDRYRVNGVYRQTMLSARQLNIAGLPQQAQTWVNQHITYTHGYGVTVSAVNQVTSDGSPDFLVQDIPLKSSAPTFEITQPRIYYGELGTEYTLVRTREPEFDYPGPEGDVYRSYDGNGGIPIGTFFNKLCFAIEFGTIKFFTTSAIEAGSRIIIKNDIRKRLAAAAPFLSFDSDPYIVVADGRLYWVADAYTTTGRYPYSQPTNDLNYLRNSVKAVVDAYDGTLTFYVFDPDDPVLATYQRIFPGMFTPKSAMPKSLLEHARYPEDYFDLQAQVFASYHVQNPSVLYNKGDQWEIPTRVSITGEGRMVAYYVIMRLPGQSEEELVLILPFSPNGRSNMIGWLGAQSDGDRYGQAVSIAFPPSETVYGPAQVEAAVNQEPTISSQRTLWGQQGSRVIFGNLLVVPVEDSLLYVQPLYLQSEQTKLPQFKRVVVFYRASSAAKSLASGDRQKVVMAPTLEEALTQIFGPKTPPPVAAAVVPPPEIPGPEPETASATTSKATLSPQAKTLIEQADRELEASEKALRAGDFAGYGMHQKKLKATLEKLKALK